MPSPDLPAPGDGAGPAGPTAFDADLRARAAGHLAGFVRRPLAPAGRRPAAVGLILLADEEGRPCFLITRRAKTLRDHAGQWALPGGRVDEGESPERAVLREVEEEVGLTLPGDAVLGVLDDYATRSGFVITPVVVWADGVGRLAPNPGEVAGIYRVPLADLDRPGVPRFVRIAQSDRPVIQLPLLGSLIHAPTAALVYQMREVVIHGRATRVDHLEQPVWAWR